MNRNPQLFGEKEWIEIQVDDIIVSCKDGKENYEILIKVLESTRKNNVKLNKDKFKFKTTDVNYPGYRVSKKSV